MSSPSCSVPVPLLPPPCPRGSARAALRASPSGGSPLPAQRSTRGRRCTAFHGIFSVYASASLCASFNPRPGARAALRAGPCPGVCCARFLLPIVPALPPCLCFSSLASGSCSVASHAANARAGLHVAMQSHSKEASRVCQDRARPRVLGPLAARRPLPSPPCPLRMVRTGRLSHVDALVYAPAALWCMTHVVLALGARSHVASVRSRILSPNALVDPRPLAVAIVANATSLSFA